MLHIVFNVFDIIDQCLTVIPHENPLLLNLYTLAGYDYLPAVKLHLENEIVNTAPHARKS